MHDDGAFGRRLRQLRRARDLTQEALAQASFCALDTVKKIESGRRRPSRQLAAQIADVLGLGGAERAAFLSSARAVAAEDEEDEPARPDAPQAPQAMTARRPLPRALTPFIGRERELGGLLGLIALPAARLVTIVAPGGMGKTRLALAAAEQCRDEEAFLDGVAFAALAPVAEPTGLDPALADALGLPLGAGDPRTPRAQLLDYLREKALLLVLDNCEHLADAVAALAGAILAEAPGVTLLATSRERLGLRAEQMLPLDGMVTEADGALLFAAMARTAQPTFALDEMTRPQVAAICARVGGMPLAIELAAGWADTLSLAEIAAELGQGDELLATQARDVPERQRSVRAVCDSTWGRLSVQERAVFAQVAVFRGGGTRRALQTVTGATLGQLQALVGKALLRYDPERERYSVHELLRQYAQERLGEDAAAMRGAQDRHAAYYLGALAEREVDLKGAGQIAALRELGRDIENVHASWRWAADHGAPDLLGNAAGALSLADEWLGRSEDGLDAFQRAVVPAEVAPVELRARLLAAQARFAFLRGDQPGALALLDQAQTMLDARNGAATDMAQSQVSLQLGHCMARYDYATAHDAYTRSQALFESDGDQWGVATALAGLGNILTSLRPSYSEAHHILDRSVTVYRTLGDQIGLSEALIHLSASARHLFRTAESFAGLSEALALAREAYALSQTNGTPRLVAQAASNLGIALCWSNAELEAYTLLRTALTIIQELGHQAELPAAHYRLGIAAMYLGRYAEARTIFTRGLAIAQRLGDALETCELLAGLTDLALIAGAYHEVLRLTEESLTLSARLGEAIHRGGAFANRAQAARGLGAGAQAWADVMAAQHFALSNRVWDETALWVVALLLADRGNPARAAEAFVIAEKTRFMDNIYMQDMGLREVRAMISALPPDVLAAAQVRWADHDYWDAVTELLAELEADGWGSEG